MTASLITEACARCGTELARGRRKFCSSDCFKAARLEWKREYDRLRYEAKKDQAIAKASAWYRDNLEQKRAYDRAYRAATSPKRNEASRQYRDRVKLIDPTAGTRRAQRRRANKAANGVFDVTRKDLAALLIRFGNACAYCRASFAGVPLEWDHVIPISRGGRHSIGNLLPSCRLPRVH